MSESERPPVDPLRAVEALHCPPGRSNLYEYGWTDAIGEALAILRNAPAAPRPEGLDRLPANLVLRPARRGPRGGIHPAYLVTEPYHGWPNGSGIGVISVHPEDDRGIANANAIAAAIVALVNAARLSDTGDTPDGAS